MSTALVTRPEVGTQSTIRRLGALRHTSPGRLRLILASLLALGVLAGLLAGLTGQSARSGTSDLGGRAQPLLVEAETIYSALADADTTAAQAFLAGGLEPADLTRRYDDDLKRATEAITAASRRTPEDGGAAASLRTLSAGIAQYSALVATARATNRQGLPIGASYLSSASQLNRDQLLPAAEQLFTSARAEVDRGYRDARSGGWVFLLVLLLVLLLAALIAAQRYLSRHTHRTFNVPLLAATALTVVLGLLSGIVLIGQNVHLRQADRDGSNPVTLLAQARILALQARGDEALTLAARGSGGAYETDYAGSMTRLSQSGGPLDELLRAGQETAEVRQARTGLESYNGQHVQVRKLDDGGSYDDAVKLAIGPEATRPFETARGHIDTAFENRKQAFTGRIDEAGNGLALLMVLGPLLALAICVFAATGLRARLEEYR